MRYRSALAAILICACPALAQPGAEPAKPADAPAAKAPAVQPVTVTLVEPGAEPRRALRYAPKVGDRFRFKMVMQMTVGMGDGNGEEEMKAPAMGMEMDVTVAPAKEEGRFRYEYILTKAGIEGDDKGPAGPMLEDLLKQMVGTRGYAEMNSRGIIAAADTTIPEGLPDQVQQLMGGMTQSLSQYSFPFPEEAVGVGAKWRVAMPIETSGMKLQQAYEVELAEAADDRVVLKVAATQNAEPQEVKNDMMPPGFVLRVKSVQGTGEGRTVVRLSWPTPEKAEMSMRSALDMVVAGNGQEQPMKQRMRMDMTMKSEPGGQQ